MDRLLEVHLALEPSPDAPGEVEVQGALPPVQLEIALLQFQRTLVAGLFLADLAVDVLEDLFGKGVAQDGPENLLFLVVEFLVPGPGGAFPPGVGRGVLFLLPCVGPGTLLPACGGGFRLRFGSACARLGIGLDQSLGNDVGLIDLAEFFAGIGPCVQVGMVFEGELAEGGFHVIQVRSGCEVEHFEAFLESHGSVLVNRLKSVRSGKFRDHSAKGLVRANRRAPV